MRYGRDAAEALRAEIVAAKGTEPLAPVTVVVPSNHVGVAARRLLASGGLGPTTVGARRRRARRGHLPHHLPAGRAARRAGPRRPGPPARVHPGHHRGGARARCADDPGMFAPVAAHPATESALVASYRELRDLARGALARRRRHGPACRATSSRLHRAARARPRDRLVRRGGPDGGGRRGPRRGIGARRRRHRSIVFLPQRRLAPRRRAARCDRRASGAVSCHRRGHRATTRPTRRCWRRSSGSARDQRRSGPAVRSGGRATEPVASTERTTIVVTLRRRRRGARGGPRASSTRPERGTPLDRIAVLYASPEPLRPAGPRAPRRGGHRGQRLRRRPARGARRRPHAPRSCSQLPERRLPPPGRVRLARRRAVLVEGGGRRSRAWERISREAGVVAGRDALGRVCSPTFADASASAGRVAADDDERPPGVAVEQRRRQDASAREQLRTFVLGLMDELEAAARTPAVVERARAAWATPAARPISSARPSRRAGWPPAERKAAERVELALDRLAALDELEAAVDLDVFTRTLTVELESDLGRVGRLGEGVLVGSVADGPRARARPRRSLLGLAEGSFPAPVRDDSLLPDARARGGGRRARAAAPTRSTGSTASSSPRSPAPRATCSASRAATSAAAASGSRPGGCSTSRRSSPGERWWASDLFARRRAVGRPRRLVRRRAAGLDVPGHRAGAPAPQPCSSQVPRRSRARRRRPRRSTRSSAAASRSSTPRSARRFTRFDGNLAGLAIPSPVDRAASATSLQRWAECPFAYLVAGPAPRRTGREPRGAARDHAARPGQPRPRGARAVRARRSSPADARPSPDTPWTAARAGPPRRDRRGGVRPLRGRGSHRPADLLAPRAARILARPRTVPRPRTTRYRADRSTRPDRHRAALRARRRAPRGAVPAARRPVGADSAARPTGSTSATTARIHVARLQDRQVRATQDLSRGRPAIRGTRLQLAVYGQARAPAPGDPTPRCRPTTGS